MLQNSLEFVLVILSLVNYGSCTENNQTIRLSTVAPYPFVYTNVSSNNTHPAPTQQTSDTFLFQDAMVPPHHQENYVSPFTKPQFKEQLLPILGAKIRDQFEGFLEDVDDGLDFIKNMFTVKQNVVKNIAYKVKNKIPLVPHPLVSATYQVDPRQKYKIPDFQPTITTRIRINTKKPYYRYAKTGAISHVCDDPIKCEKKHNVKETQPQNYNELGVNGMREFEESVLKKLEKIEEKKVEATLGTYSEKHENNVIKGKPYGFHNDWKPVSYHNQHLDTKSSGTNNPKVKSQLHTSFSGSSAARIVAGPSEPYPIKNHIHSKNMKKVKVNQKTANVKFHPSSTKMPAYGSIQEIIASTVDTSNKKEYEPIYDNHVTHSQFESGFTPILYDDSKIDASKNNEISAQKVPQKKRKIIGPRSKSTTTTTTTTTATPAKRSPSSSTENLPRSSSFKWPKVSSDTASSPSESKLTKVFVRTSGSQSTPKAQSLTMKRPLPERHTSHTDTSKKGDGLPPVTKSPFVDKVRKTGYRGKIKFGVSSLNAT